MWNIYLQASLFKDKMKKYAFGCQHDLLIGSWSICRYLTFVDSIFFSLRNGQSVIVVLIMLFLFTFDTAIVKLNISINPNASSFGENAWLVSIAKILILTDHLVILLLLVKVYYPHILKPSFVFLFWKKENTGFIKKKPKRSCYKMVGLSAFNMTTYNKAPFFFCSTALCSKNAL